MTADFSHFLLAIKLLLFGFFVEVTLIIFDSVKLSCQMTDKINRFITSSIDSLIQSDATHNQVESNSNENPFNTQI